MHYMMCICTFCVASYIYTFCNNGLVLGLPVAVCADPRVSAKVALTPQRKSFGGGCSWRNKVGGSDSQEDNVDGGASSALRREEAGAYGLEEEETAGADDEYCFGRAEYKAAPYHGHASHPLSSGVDRGSERVVRTPRKIDHVPLRDQARRGADYEEGREQHRGLHQDRVSLAHSRHPTPFVTRVRHFYSDIACWLKGDNISKIPHCYCICQGMFPAGVH